jgi:hypothetical protein
MNREIGSLDQADDGFEPTLIRNCKRRINAQAKLGQAYDISHIQVFKLFVVWDVEKDGIDTLATCHALPITCHGLWREGEIRFASL